MTKELYVTSIQEREILACREFYYEPKIRLTVMHGMPDEPLEKTRIRGPFSAEVVSWYARLNTLAPQLIKLGTDADGFDYIEY